MSEIPLNPRDPNGEAVTRQAPDGPGVYLFKDAPGKVIYVGKAKSLKRRLHSYFRDPQDLSRKTALMMARAASLDYILTTTEKEAFILESSLIKDLMPRYNIVLRDDKQYPCLRLDLNETYPRLRIVRRIKKDGARYFGPFSSANAVRSTLKLIDRIFQLRKCKGAGLPKRSRPCLNYQMDRCLGPCTREVSVAGYREIVEQVRLFLEGRNGELIRDLRKQMGLASDQLNFEKAARIRDQIRSVEKTVERQHVVSPRLEDQDVLGLAETDGTFQLVLFIVRKGYLTGTREFFFRNEGGTTSEVMEAFLKQYYRREAFVPKRILVSESVDDLPGIAAWISELAGLRVSIEHPLRGEKARLVDMAVSNARDLLSRKAQDRQEDLLERAGSVLNMTGAPRVIEGLDISNLQGDMAVGAVVSFVEGLPHRAGYRNYRIRDVDGIDDYGMISELASRRLSSGGPPDLFVVDGGKGHLQAVKRVVDSFPEQARPELVALAKGGGGGGDKAYLPGRKNPLPLRVDDPVLLLLMRVRDEAHRRAVSYHRKLRGKRLKEGDLDRIPGIGKKRKRRLLEHFPDIHAIARAEPEELARISGISPRLAEKITDFFTRTEG
ncbi:MAG: excinuclease ABC subunit UvrC [Deltaproteobacteria bacterium]|nr:excinuclease ABC subunit UvrC [Deltaproteobacteria bacterium]